MKLRNGFVSNSSSCSFTVYKIDADGNKNQILQKSIDQNAVCDCGEGDPIDKICLELIKALGHNPDEYKVEIESW